ncbi:MAG: molybdenum cofactor guanylyltransferase [Deltaproteobacteria bacterium]|nr:molybdenum cofactor guanylyltransferase [Deltaproteobacteria bacterium]
MIDATGVILAGGQSRRMGLNKALIEVDGLTIIERTVALFNDIFDDVIVAVNDVGLYSRLDAMIVTDVYKGAATLGGIYTGLFHSQTPYTFVVACDMPFLDARAIKKTLELSGSDATAPFINDKLHAMHTVYSRRCLKKIEGMITAGNLRVSDLFSMICTRRLVEADFAGIPILSSIENVNTPEDLSRIRADEGR